jgi:hypothetical protein
MRGSTSNAWDTNTQKHERCIANRLCFWGRKVELLTPLNIWMRGLFMLVVVFPCNGVANVFEAKLDPKMV